MSVYLSMALELGVAAAFVYLALHLTRQKDSRQVLIMGLFLGAVCFVIAALASLWFLGKARTG